MRQFMKALKESVRVLINKVLTLLGFASRAGELVFGVSLSVKEMKSGKAKCVVFAEDISPKSRKEILFYANEYGIKVFELKSVNMEKLSRAVGRKCGVVAILSETFANPIISYLTSGI